MTAKSATSGHCRVPVLSSSLDVLAQRVGPWLRKHYRGPACIGARNRIEDLAARMILAFRMALELVPIEVNIS
jgi:hypothetical protein